MAHLTFYHSDAKLAQFIDACKSEIEAALREQLPKLGVAKSDVVVCFAQPHTHASEPHVEIILKTDNAKVTARVVVGILLPVIGAEPFEVSRVAVGYLWVEAWYELWSIVFRRRRNWASNYPPNESDSKY